MKEMFRDEFTDCTPAKLLKIMTAKKPTLGDMYANKVKLLKVHESFIILRAAVESVSRVKRVTK